MLLDGPPEVPPRADVGGGVMWGLLVAARTLPCGEARGSATGSRTGSGTGSGMHSATGSRTASGLS